MEPEPEPDVNRVLLSHCSDVDRSERVIKRDRHPLQLSKIELDQPLNDVDGQQQQQPVPVPPSDACMYMSESDPRAPANQHSPAIPVVDVQQVDSHPTPQSDIDQCISSDVECMTTPQSTSPSRGYFNTNLAFT